GASGTISFKDVSDACNAGKRLMDLDALREQWEELGINWRTQLRRRFLGASRELIRGGTPEFYYAVDVDISEKEIRKLRRKEREGEIHSIFVGGLKSFIESPTDVSRLTEKFWDLAKEIGRRTAAPISVPLLTNLAFWAWANDPSFAGEAGMSQLAAAAD